MSNRSTHFCHFSSSIGFLLERRAYSSIGWKHSSVSYMGPTNPSNNPTNLPWLRNYHPATVRLRCNYTCHPFVPSNTVSMIIPTRWKSSVPMTQISTLESIDRFPSPKSNDISHNHSNLIFCAPESPLLDCDSTSNLNANVRMDDLDPTLSQQQPHLARKMMELDSFLQEAMKKRKKELTVDLFHQSLGMLVQQQQENKKKDHSILLSCETYKSLIYMLTPHDLHGAVLAFELYQQAIRQSPSSQPQSQQKQAIVPKEKNNAHLFQTNQQSIVLFHRILRSIELASPFRSTKHLFYDWFLQQQQIQKQTLHEPIVSLPTHIHTATHANAKSIPKNHSNPIVKLPAVDYHFLLQKVYDWIQDPSSFLLLPVEEEEEEGKWTNTILDTSTTATTTATITTRSAETGHSHQYEYERNQYILSIQQDLIPRFLYSLLKQKYTTSNVQTMKLDLWKLSSQYYVQQSSSNNQTQQQQQQHHYRSEVENLYSLDEFDSRNENRQFVENDEKENETISKPYSQEITQEPEFHTFTSMDALSIKRNHTNILTWYENILRSSSYRRQEEFPFGKVLDLVVMNGGRPGARIAINILLNEYPFQNIRMVHSVLNSIYYLQKTKKSWEQEYRVDLGTLQHIFAMAARRGSSDLILLLWEYMEEVGGYPMPTEAMYEDTVVAFIGAGWRDHLALHALYEMESKGGYTPHRSLIRTVSRSIRPMIGRMDNFIRLIKEYHPQNDAEDQGNEDSSNRFTTEVKPKVTTAMLNCALSANAEWGLVDRAFSIFDEFGKLNCEPNSDTFSFLMEAIAVNTTTAIATTEAESIRSAHGTFGDWVAMQVHAAEVIIQTMKEMKILWTHHMIHSYIQILCSVGQSAKAYNFLVGMEKLRVEKDSSPRILLETFIMLATSFATQGDKIKLDSVIQMCQEYGHILPPYASDRLNQLRRKIDANVLTIEK